MATLIIRREQMQALEDDAQKRAIAAHIGKFFPETQHDRTAREWRSAITAAIRRARSYGLRAYRDIEQYAVLAMTLGENFEEREEFAWVREVLEDRHPARAPFRATWVYERITNQLAG